MNSLSNMKEQLAELEDRKTRLAGDIQNADRRYKIGLWTMVAGAFLIPVYGVGLLAVIAGGYLALANSGKRARAHDQLEQIDSEIGRLQRSMV